MESALFLLDPKSGAVKRTETQAVMEENEYWFGHYIWGDPLPAALTPRVKAAKP